MENTKKFNKLSIISFILSLVIPIIITLAIFDINLPININIRIYIFIAFVSFILSRVSSYKIRKNNEKGKGFNYVSLAIFTIVVIGLIFLVYISSESGKKDHNRAMKSQLASIRAQSELYYQSSDESFIGLCETPQDKNGLGGISGPGLLLSINVTSAKNTTKCFSDNGSWVVTSGLIDFTKPYTHYCTDITGFFGPITTSQNDSIINADTLCP